MKAIAAENLDRFVHDIVEHFAAIDFGDGTFHGVFF
jgi:hypothetical protein